MKISLLLLAAVGSTTTAFEFGERQLQTCPTPSTGAACTLEEDPVKCGLDGEFHNALMEWIV